MRALSLLIAIVVGMTPVAVGAAGFRVIDVPANAGRPSLKAGVWTPCAQPSQEISLGQLVMNGMKECPIVGERMPLIVMSSGFGGSYFDYFAIAAALADAGFVVAVLSHPGDTFGDDSRQGELSLFVQRPTDLKRLVDHMLAGSPAASAIDRDRIGVFGFSHGGYTGLVAAGATPDWPSAERYCSSSSRSVCRQILAKVYPDGQPPHDARIKAAVIADPLAIFFGPSSYAGVKVPVQLWASQYGGSGVMPADVALVDASLPAPHEYRVVPNAGHFAFVGPCPPAIVPVLPQLCVDGDGFDRVAFYQQFNADVLAFFRKHL